MDELVQYYVVNSELGMSTGKVAAQVAHVATIISVDMMDPASKKFSTYKHWFFQWFNSDMKKVVLRGKQKDLEKLIDNGFYYIRDNGLTEIPKDSLTVVGLPPMLKSDAQSYVKRLQIYKG